MYNLFSRVADFHQSWKLCDNNVSKCIANFRSSLRIVNLKDCYWISSTIIQQSLGKCNHLIEINLLGCCVTAKSLNSILLRNPTIKTLSWSVPGNITNDIYADTRFAGDLATAFKRLELLTLQINKKEAGAVLSLFNDEMSLLQLTVLFQTATPIFSVKTTKRLKVSSPFNSGNFFVHLQDILLNAVRTMAIEVLVSTIATIPDKDLIQSQIMHLKKLDVCGSSYLLAKKTNELIYFSSRSCSLSADNLWDVCRLNSNLESLNLQGSENCLGHDLSGLRSIADYCRNLRHLNISEIHYHCKTNGNKLLEMIASITTLESLSVSDCMLAVSSAEKLRTSKDTTSSILFKSSKRVSRLPVSETASSGIKSVCASGGSRDQTSSCSSIGNSEEGNMLPGNSRPGINCLPKKYATHLGVLHEMKEFEMIKSEKNNCDWLLSNEDLLVVCQWKKLRKLTIYGIKLLGRMDFLLSVAQTCSALEFLSLANIDDRYSSLVYTFHLIGALPFFHCLKSLRLEQAHSNITQPLLTSLYGCQRLHSLCIITRGGRIQDGVNFFQLLNTCKELTVVYISCESPAIRMKRIQKDLVASFRCHRPALSVTMLPYAKMSNQQSPEIPDCVKNDLVAFESKVANFFST